MKLALFGASGMAGTRITDEALRRGHNLTAIVRDRSRLNLSHDRLTVVVGNVLDRDRVAEIVKGHDAVITTVGPGNSEAYDPAQAKTVVEAARSLVEALTEAGVRRLVAVGGAGSLEIAPGVQWVDSPDFPEQYRPASLAHREALGIYQQSDLDWTFFCPAAIFEAGDRTGKFRVQADKLLFDENGISRISAEDYAIALLDEIEQPQYIRRRMTAAY